MLEAFYKHRTSLLGRQGKCKACTRAEFRVKFAAHPEVYRARSARWARENPEKANDQSAKWRAANPEKARAAFRKSNSKVAGAVTPAYAAQKLGLSVSLLTPELLALKREQLTVSRLAKQLKRRANETLTNIP